jgi:pimeloyl-ACP methyl ester carboxylesterase
MPYADLASRSLYYERRGSGAPLLLIQGMAGHHAVWGEPFLDRLARDFDVVAYDHRGIGESTDVPGDFTIAELAADAVDLLDRLGWDSAHVVGISLGGMVAQEIAIKHPAQVRSLVLGCTYCGGPGSILTAPGPLRMLQAMNSGNADAAVRAGFTANLSPGFTADESNYEPFKTTALSVRVPVPLVVRQAKAGFGHDTSGRLGQITAPTLVLHGTADEMIAYENGPMIAGLIPGARLHTFEGIGHLFWWELPDETADLIRAHALPD